jgi:hypothetical protein
VIALLASFLILVYILVPGALFRSVVTLFLPMRAFDRTRTQEFAYAVSVCVLPLLVALALVWWTPVIRYHPFAFADTWQARNRDYKTIFLSAYADRFVDDKDELWAAMGRAGRRQARLAVWYYLLVVLEAWVLGSAAKNFGRWQYRLQRSAPLDWATRKLLLPSVSEWHVLLTDFLYPGAAIEADVLTGEDRLYRGEILDFTIDKEGSLTGIYLQRAERFDRVGYLDAKKTGQPKTQEYWRDIPGEKLFILADKIYTLNIRPRARQEMLQSLARELDPNAVVTVERETQPREADEIG